MNKRKIFILICLIALLFVFNIFSGTFIVNAQDKNSDLFNNTKGITVTDNRSVPEKLKDKDGKDVPTTFDSGKNGVLLTSSEAGATVDIAKTIKGNFETQFRVYSDVHYFDETGKDWNSNIVKINPYCDLEELSIIFTDDNGQTFEVIISGGEKYNTVTPGVHVKVGDARFGYHYADDAIVPSDTALKNSGGYYTRIGGTTFSNVTRRGKVLTTDSAPITIGFNIETMEVYCYNYGITKYFDESQRQYRVIADLDSEDFGLYQFDNFGDYKVSFSFNSIANGKTAKMLVYNINGQNLSGANLVNSIGPNTIASFKTNSVKGNKYVLPTPLTFDLLEDGNNFKTLVDIKDDSGNAVKLYSANGSVITNKEYAEGCYINHNKEGKITISYTSYDSEGKVGKTSSYSIYNFPTIPTSIFDYDGLEENYNLASKGIGDSLNIYPCKVSSPLYLGDGMQYANVSLYKDGAIVDDFEGKVIENIENVKLEAGSYKLVYFIEGFYNEDYSYEFVVSSDTPQVSFSSELSDKYIYGKKIEIPSATYTLNGTSKRGTAVLYDPDGKQVNISNGEALLEKVGLYKLTYMVRLNEVYSFDYYFSSVHSANGLFTEQKNITAEYGNTGDLFKNEINGIVVSSTKNDSEIKYNKVIDLTTNTKNDSLIEIIPIPTKKGTLDAWQYTIKLTDIHDEKNFVTIVVFKGSWGNQWSYVRVGSSKQVLSGLEANSVLTGYNVGTPINYSMTGEHLLGNEILQLYYDNSEKAVYVDNIKRSGYSYGNLVIDMDNPEYFEEKDLWGGFTTGEVYLSLSVQYLQSEKAQFLIKSLNGVSFENEWIKDTDVPSLTVNTLGYEENNLPNALINREYPLFDAKAYDALDGVIGYDLSVYKDYQTINQKLVASNTKTFTPTEEGEYSLVYTATDSSKNPVTKVLKLRAVSLVDELNHQFEESLKTSISQGETLEIPTSIVSGGSGNIDTIISVIDPDGQHVDINNGKVFIEKYGTYKVSVKLTDYIGTEEVVNYIITASISEDPIVGELSFNSTMIEGYEYDLSSFEAFDYYSNNGVAVDAIKSVEIIQNGKTTTLDSSLKYTPKANKNGEEITIRFIAKAKSGNGKTILERKAHLIQILDSDKNYNLANLFYQEKISKVNSEDKYVEYVTSTEGALIEYVNYLVADGFSLNFTVNKDKNNFGAIEITLQDSMSSNQKVVLTIKKSGTSSSIVSINEIDNLTITSDFYQTTAYGFKFYFNAKSNSIIDGNTNKAISAVKHNLDGSEFKGFTSGKIKASIRFVGVVGESAIRVTSISNQSLSNDTKDRVSPAIQIMGEIKSIGEINEKFIVYRAMASDGIDPSPKTTVQISKSGKTIYSGEISKDYEFIPSEYGEYIIKYISSDSNNKKTTITYVITVKDRIKPELSVNGDVITTAKVGETYTLPTATVTDNNDKDLPVYLFVLAPDGEQRANKIGDYSFTPTLKGEYKITYYVFDSYNCYTYVEYTIKVK